MAITYKIMKTFTRPDGNDKVQYEIVDDAGRKMIAPDWYEHEDEAFATGQYIVKDGILYRFLVPHTAGAEWNSAEVLTVTVAEDIAAIVTALNQKANKVSGATSGHFAGLDANGNPTDSGYFVGTGSPSDSKLWPSQTTFSHMSNFLSLKADKVTGATENNFAALTSSGNLKDSGKKPSDFITEHQDISGKADKVQNAAENNFAALDANGNLKDSGHKHSDYLTEHQDISGKADKVQNATSGNLAGLDGNGNPTDSGYSVDDTSTDATKLWSAQKTNSVETQLKSSIAQKAPLIRDTVTNVPIASVPDGADGLPLTSLKIAVEPVQDLHGYDSPWPAGGGANLFDVDKATASQSAYGLTISINGPTITISGTATGTGNLGFNVVNYADYSLSGKGYIVQAFDYTGNKTLGNIYGFRTENEKAVAIRIDGVTSGDSVNVSLKISVAVTSQTSWSPYSNICPISGWTGCNVPVTGVNVWDEVCNLGIINSDGSVSTSSNRLVTDYISVIPGITYYLVGEQGRGRGAYYDANKNFLSYYADFPETDKTFTVPANAKYLRYCLTVAYGSTYNNNVSFNYPSTDHDYHAFIGSTHPISWQDEAGTVYGGTLDVLTGVLTVDRAMVDLGTLTWGYSSSGSPFFYANLSGIKRPANWGAILDAVCSNYKSLSGNAVSFGEIGVGGNPGNDQIRICDPAYTDATAFTTAMSGVQLVYELATPLTYQLTPTQITALRQMNVWADTGNIIEMTYPCDTKLYIDKKLAELTALVLES